MPRALNKGFDVDWKAFAPLLGILDRDYRPGSNLASRKLSAIDELISLCPAHVISSAEGRNR
jgi:hypothetical protein